MNLTIHGTRLREGLVTLARPHICKNTAVMPHDEEASCAVLGIAVPSPLPPERQPRVGCDQRDDRFCEQLHQMQVAQTRHGSDSGAESFNWQSGSWPLFLFASGRFACCVRCSTAQRAASKRFWSFGGEGAAIPIQARISAGCDWNSCKLAASSREAKTRGQVLQVVQVVKSHRRAVAMQDTR